MTDDTSFVLTVVLAALIVGLWFGKLLSDSRWEYAAHSDRMRIRSGDAEYYVVRVDDVERAERVETLVRASRRR